MSEATPSLPQYAFMAWCLVKAQGQLYLYLYGRRKEERTKWQEETRKKN
jgi:hypothetical protein